MRSTAKAGSAAPPLTSRSACATAEMARARPSASQLRSCWRSERILNGGAPIIAASSLSRSPSGALDSLASDRRPVARALVIRTGATLAVSAQRACSSATLMRPSIVASAIS